VFSRLSPGDAVPRRFSCHAGTAPASGTAEAAVEIVGLRLGAGGGVPAGRPRRYHI